MNAVLLDPSIYREASRRRSRHSPGLAWLEGPRSVALERFLTRGFPGIAEEEWRYTDLREAAARTARFLSDSATEDGPAEAALTKQDVVRFLGDSLAYEDAITAVLVNGRYRPELSSAQTIAGLRISSLPDAAAADQQRIRGTLETLPPAQPSALSDMNTAMISGGLVIEASEGAHLPHPVHVIFISSGAALASSRLFVTAGQDSRMSIVEHHFSTGAGVSNIITQANCGTGAALDFLKLQAESDDAIHLAAQSFEVAARAKLQLTHLDLGARLARNDLTVTLRGEGGEVSAQGLFLADGARHLDNHTRIEHRARHTTSRETYRGIANQTGRGVFNGKIIVFPGADRTDARLTNQNLLLARGAEVDTKPELEIYADDVKCSHGATTGRLDAQAIFYLQSRGIDEETARRMLVSAFAGQIVGSIQFPALREHLAAVLRRRLGGLADDGVAA